MKKINFVLLCFLQPFCGYKTRMEFPCSATFFFNTVAKENILRDIILCQTQQEITMNLWKMLSNSNNRRLLPHINLPIILQMLFCEPLEKINSSEKVNKTRWQIQLETKLQIIRRHTFSWRVIFMPFINTLVLPVYSFALNENMAISFWYYPGERHTS